MNPKTHLRLFCVLLAACLLLPERGQSLLQIFRTCGLFLAAYLPLLYLTGALVPNDRRWLRRTLSRGKGH